MPRRRATTPRSSKRRITIAIAAGLVILLGVAGVVIWRVTSGSAATTSTQRTVAVTEQTIKDTVGTTGTVEPKHRADLSFASSGTVTSVKVAVGDKVSKGQKLAAIGDDELQADLEAARADYQAAKDDLTTAEDNSATTDNELNAAKSKVAVQKSMVAQAKNALAAATLRSPINGTVAAVTIAKGDTVGSAAGSSGTGSSNGSGSGSGTGASNSADLTVISKGTFTVATTVGSADLAKIKKGLQAEITITGASTPIYGTVSSVAVMASSSGSGTTTSGSAATFAVTIDVTGTQKNLYAGASATVSIIVKQRANVLTVPTAAISTANGKSVVQKLVNGKPVATEITVGESYGATTEVTRGLNAGDQVVITIANRTPTGTSTGTATRGQGTGGGRFNNGGFNNGGFPSGQGQGQGQPQGNATGGTR